AAVTGGVPARLSPLIAYNCDHIDKVAAPDGVMHQMGMPPHPEIERWRAHLDRRVGSARQCPPGRMPGETRLALVPQSSAQSRPQPVCPDECQRTLLDKLLRHERGHGHSDLVGGKILDLRVEAERNVCVAPSLLEKDFL